MVKKLDSDGILHTAAIKRKIGDGRDTNFWKDAWFDNTPLAIRFPRLYNLENLINAMVRDKWNGANFMWNWPMDIRGGVEQSQLHQISNCIGNVIVVNTHDKWVWECNQDKDFTVKGVRKHIDISRLPRHYLATRWNKYVPRKVFNLLFRGIHNNSLVCPCCNNGIETLHHLLVECRIAYRVWNSMSRWLGINILHNQNLINILDYVGSLNHHAKVKDIITIIIYAVWWELWQFRNDAIFEPSKRRDMVLVDTVISTAFFWYNNRNKKSNIRSVE